MTTKQKISKLHRKLDKLAQLYYIKKHPVSILGGRTEVMHHFIYKSQSTYLRYEEKNLIPLTKGQHFSVHNKGEGLEAEIRDKKGKKWYNWIKENRSILIKRDVSYLEYLKELETDYE